MQQSFHDLLPEQRKVKLIGSKLVGIFLGEGSYFLPKKIVNFEGGVSNTLNCEQLLLLSL